MAERTAVSRKRVVYLDLLRLFATFQMLQGHAIDAVLQPQFRSGSVHAWWVHVRGYTAPAFLFAAGFAFYLTTLRPGLGAQADAPANHWRRLRRFGMLIALGYMMHLPPSLEQVWDYAIVDVLQCIGVSLMALELLRWWFPASSVALAASAILTVSCFALAPLFADWLPLGPWRIFSNYVNHAGGSLFPLLPHGGYLFAGVCTGAVAASTYELACHRWRLLVLSGCSWLVVGTMAMAHIDTMRIERLAVVLSITSLLALAWGNRTALGYPWSTFARQTLVIYWVHVWVLYAKPWGVQYWYGRILGPWGAIAFALLVVVASLACGLFWEKITRRSQTRTQPLEPETASR
ncbi:MAG: DUF1624 domain-containing protein [Myxococcales bacterium]|nr:DUF1624 domain-containing protein [Myxococcales bacterium]